MALGRRILAFAGLPLLSLIAPFLFLPVLARTAPTDAWVGIALGQSVGGFSALIASWGYSTLAPPKVATAGTFQRVRILVTSLHVRLPLWLVAASIAMVATSLLAPVGVRFDSALMALAMSLAGLAPTWFWIGVGRVKPIVLLEVLPRIVATIMATVVLVAGGSVMWYPALLTMAMLCAPVVVAVRYAGREVLKVEREELRTVIREHPPAVIAESAAGVYNSLAIALVTSAAPIAQVGRYVSGDKVYRIGQYGVSALGNALQGWVVQDGKRSLGRRLRAAVVLHALLGSFGMVSAGVAGPWLTQLLFGQDVAISSATAWGFGLALLGVSLGTAFGRIGLIALGARQAFMWCVIFASAGGVVALLLGAAAGGAAGAAWALGAIEIASAATQGVVLACLWRRKA